MRAPLDATSPSNQATSAARLGVRSNIGADLDQLLESAAELGVRIRVCDMSMKLMGIRPGELIDYPVLELSGVANFLESCCEANTTLFI